MAHTKIRSFLVFHHLLDSPKRVLEVPRWSVEDGNPLEVAPKSLEGDAITKRYGAAVHFSYSAPSTFSNKLGDEGNSVSSGGETTKFNRDRVEASLKGIE